MRAVADLLAQRMLELEGGTWGYTDFFAVTRGDGLHPTKEEIRAFRKRCSAAGVHLSYDDGTEVGSRGA